MIGGLLHRSVNQPLNVGWSRSMEIQLNFGKIWSLSWVNMNIKGDSDGAMTQSHKVYGCYLDHFSCYVFFNDQIYIFKLLLH